MMEQCTHCGAWVDADVCPYCDSLMPSAEKKKAAGKTVKTETKKTADDEVIKLEYTADEEAAASAGTSSFSVPAGRKSKMIALILCVFLGMFGAHYFYVGKIGKGILYLLTCGVFYIGWIIDIIRIITGSFTDVNGEVLL